MLSTDHIEPTITLQLLKIIINFFRKQVCIIIIGIEEHFVSIPRNKAKVLLHENELKIVSEFLVAKDAKDANV